MWENRIQLSGGVKHQGTALAAKKRRSTFRRKKKQALLGKCLVVIPRLSPQRTQRDQKGKTPARSQVQQIHENKQENWKERSGVLLKAPHFITTTTTTKDLNSEKH